MNHEITLEKKSWTHEIPREKFLDPRNNLQKKKLDPRNTDEKNIWANETPTSKKFGPMKYQRRHDSTMARKRNLAHSEASQKQKLATAFL